jgi:hypothetical protein
MTLQVRKVTEVPAVLEAHTMYLVEIDTEAFGIVVTDATGSVAKAIVADALPPNAEDIQDSTAVGRSILTAADAAAIRTILGTTTAASPVFTGPVSLNGSFGTAGQVPTSQGSGNPAIWADPETSEGGAGGLTAESIFYANIFGA